uniref:protein-tyrosine-phosphatase n=1 Tax=Angiostrongylus cantonensis TaxID=6313 RepID=A0A158P6T0_ANGCA
LNFDVVLTAPNQVRLTWDRPLHVNSHSNFGGYYVYVEKLLNGEPVNRRRSKYDVINDLSKRYWEIDKLEPNTEYAFRMNAFNRNGDGEYTETKRIVTGGIPPQQPEIQSVVLLGDEAPLRARVEWKRPQLAPLESPIDRYNLWYKAEGNSHHMKKIVNGTMNSAELTGLLMGRVYEILLGAENVEGHSKNATEQLVTPIGNPEGEPVNVQYEIMRISWEPPAEDRRNGNITAYKAILTPMDSNGERIEKQVTDSSASATFAVDVRKAYTFKVAAATMKGLGPFSPVLTINPDPAAIVGPPTNVRVEATSNSSAVVQWDFESGQVDGFVVKYMHEPGGRSDSDKWTARTVMSPNSRHLEVPHLTAHKPYAFCVLAIKNNRQGACSDPPTLLEKLTPTYMVQNLVVEWKTSNSVKLRWEYNGPAHIGFYLNHTGKKEYFDHTLAMKSMTTPGFKHELDEGSREYLWTNLRPYMQYTFHVGVRTLPPGGRQYWPKEVVIVTDPTGPPFVFPPEIDDLVTNGIGGKQGQIVIRLRPASEEYGPISHYWLIVVPGNYSKDDMVNMGPVELEAATIARRKTLEKQISVSPTIRVCALEGVSVVTEHSRRIRKRYNDLPTTAYITARIEAEEMRKMYTGDRSFIVGDDKIYNGFNNFPLQPSTKYRLMVRSFAKIDGGRKNERAPMGEKLTRLYSDSALTEPFTTRAAQRTSAKAGGVWLIGPLIALLIIAILIGMLVCWWLRCNKKSAGRGHRHGSITKVALTGNIMNGIPSETSKLLSTDTFGRTVMNPYEQMNGHGNTHMESSVDLYPLPRTQSRTDVGNYAPVPIQFSCLPSSGSHLATHPAIPISELAHHIEQLRLNNNAGFQQEFESIETGQQFTWENSSAEMNKHKNRYANVVAYDHSRVVLSTINDIPGSDYINANYIDGYDKPKAYIATQGPLPETFDDFWRMVWEEGTSTIVMLTNLEERSRIKCDQYWPTRGSSTYGEIQVTLLETTVLAHYTMRAFRIQVVGEMEMREIRHLQYTAWPDHGVPDHPTPFLIFLKRVKTLNPPDAGPIISHCSAGIGRTGAFIVVDCMLERLRYENTVDIFGCVTSLRSQRSYMVQTEDQYVFIHDAVLDAVNSGSTEVPIMKLRQHVMALQQVAPMEGAAGMELEFRHLSALKWGSSRCSIANLVVNRHKNRHLAVVPYDSNRVVMQLIPGVEGSDYMNASWVDGYRQRCAYIATQGPTDQTIGDFWRMIWEHDCAIVVMLTKTWELGREKCSEYWPQETGAQVGQLVVEPIAEYNMREYILREFRLSDSGLSRTVRHFQYSEWPEQGAPKSAETFLDFIQQVHRTKSQFGVDGPIVVHCSSGAGRTGVFIALAIIIDRMRLEHVVDVFTTVKLLRTERQNMVQDKDQYYFLYMAALEFLSSYEQYPSS